MRSGGRAVDAEALLTSGRARRAHLVPLGASATEDLVHGELAWAPEPRLAGILHTAILDNHHLLREMLIALRAGGGSRPPPTPT